MKVNKSHQDSIDLERGRAMNAFAKLESTLCWILAEAGNLDHKIASTIFYSNISLQPRVEITSAVIEAACGDLFKSFWESACKVIDSLNKQRNKIVHWHSYPVFEGKKSFEHTKCVLIHPVIDSDKPSELSVHDIRQFIDKAEYTANVLNKFRICFDNSIDVLQKQYVDLFSGHVISFPPPENDPFIS